LGVFLSATKEEELRAWFPRAWKWMFSQQQFSAGSTGQWKHPLEEPLEVQRDLFSAPGGKQNNLTNSPTTVNATETSGVNSGSRGAECPNNDVNGGAAESYHGGGSSVIGMAVWRGVDEGDADEDVDVEGGVVGVEKELEDEVERKRNLWLTSLKTIEVVAKSRFLFRKAVGDGNCLFYCLLRNNTRQLAQDLRNDVASWIEANPLYLLEGMTVELWISHQVLRGTLTIASYAKSLRYTLPGGELEIQVFAELYQTEVFVFQELNLHSYRKTFCARASITPLQHASRVSILYSP